MKSEFKLDAASLSLFASTLAGLPEEEVRKAKKLHILNSIAEYEAQRASAKGFLIVLGFMSIIPIFLIIFIPLLITYKKGVVMARQMILNAIEVWKDDLGNDYEQIRNQVLVRKTESTW